MTAADKTKLDAITGTNTGDVTLAAVGSTPNANGASLSGQVLTLQLASASFPGLMSTVAQTFTGVKTFSSAIESSVADGNYVIKTSGSPAWGIWRNASAGQMLFDVGGATPLSISSSGTVAIANGFVVRSSQASAANAFEATVAGARWKIGPGGNDYLTSDGANTISTPGIFSALTRINAGAKYQLGGADVLVLGGVSTNDTFIQSNVADGASTVAVTVNSANALANAAAKLLSVRNNGTEKVAADRAGKLIVPTGQADSVAGVATLVGGTVTVSTTSVKTGSTVLYARKTTGGTVGQLSVTIVDATSFTINSSSGTETSTVSWFIVN